MHCPFVNEFAPASSPDASFMKLWYPPPHTCRGIVSYERLSSHSQISTELVVLSMLFSPSSLRCSSESRAGVVGWEAIRERGKSYNPVARTTRGCGQVKDGS